MTEDIYRLIFETPVSFYENVSSLIALADDFLGLSENEEKPQIILFEAYFSNQKSAQKTGKSIQQANYTQSFVVEKEIPKDYNALWREQVQPVLVAPNVWVSPDWKPPVLTENDTWIKIEPQMAFGTGHHATTKLSSSLLIKALAQKTAPAVIDIGTGSGVLAFIAKVFGASYSLGIENDPCCLDNMLHNRTLNNLDGQVDLIIGDNSSVPKSQKFDICVINIIRKYSLPQLPWIHNSLNQNGILVWSGILADDTAQCIQAAKDAGFTLIEEAYEDKWWAALFKKED